MAKRQVKRGHLDKERNKNWNGVGASGVVRFVLCSDLAGVSGHDGSLTTVCAISLSRADCYTDLLVYYPKRQSNCQSFCH